MQKVSSEVSKQVPIFWKELEKVIKGLGKPLRLQDLPEVVQQVTRRYVEIWEREEELTSDHNGVLVANALRQFWLDEVRPWLTAKDAKSLEWVEALVPMAQYIEPVREGEQSSREKAMKLLMDEGWVKEWTGDESRAKGVVEFVEMRVDGGKVYESTYNRWRVGGVKLLSAALKRTLAAPLEKGVHVGAIPPLPEVYVPRMAALRRAKELILRAQEDGSWVAIIGMNGVGKSTLLVALGHDDKLQRAFMGGVRYFEVQREMTSLALARLVSRSLGKSLFLKEHTVEEARDGLHSELEGQKVLLLVDNVWDSRRLDVLRNLGPGIVVVFATRDARLASSLALRWQVHLERLTEQEAWKLIRQIHDVPEDEEQAARATLRLLEYHPFAVTIAAAGARERKRGWPSVLESIKDAKIRLSVMDYPGPLNVWAPLEISWADMEASQRRCLEALGRLPFLAWYDVGTGMAVWRMSEAEARAMWDRLVALHLAEELDGESDCYRLHWLIWDFARQKAGRWPWWERLSLVLWEWRYPGSVGPRWWSVLPKPPDGPEWPVCDFTIPGTEDEPGPIFLWRWLVTRGWRKGEESLSLAAGAEEWVGTVRVWHRVLLSSAGLILLTLIVRIASNWPASWKDLVYGAWLLFFSLAELLDVEKYREPSTDCLVAHDGPLVHRGGGKVGSPARCRDWLKAVLCSGPGGLGDHGGANNFTSESFYVIIFYVCQAWA